MFAKFNIDADTTDYGHQAKHVQALKDIRGRLGIARYSDACRVLRMIRDAQGRTPSESKFRWHAAFYDIGGYHAYAWYVELFPYG